LRSLPCVDYQNHNKTINDGVVSYILIQKPKPGDPFVDLCKFDSDLIRVCRYMIKDFIKGYLNAFIYSINSKNNFELFFLVNKFAFYYGKKGKVTDTVTQANSGIREILVSDKQKQSNVEMQNEDDFFYLTIPFFKFTSPEGITTQMDPVDEPIKLIRNKQTLVYFGKLLVDMYKGLSLDRENGFNAADGSFNPNLLRFQNLTDVYLHMHRNDKTHKYNHFYADPYMGFTKNYLDKLKQFMDGSLSNQQKVKDMDNLLSNTYSGFISKMVNFDDKNEKQFDSLESALNHPFLTANVNEKQIRSDTSFDL